MGWGGDVDVRENLQHIRMLRNFLGWVGWGGDVDVRENLQHIRMLRNFLGGVGWVPFLPCWHDEKKYICFFQILHILLYLFFYCMSNHVRSIVRLLLSCGVKQG